MEQQVKRLLENKKTIIALLSFIIVTLVLSITAYASSEKTITLVANGKEKEVKTHAGTVNELLTAQGIKAGNHDLVTPGKTQALSDNMKVVYKTAHKIQWTDNGKKQAVWTTADTVQDFFNTHHITLNSHDLVQPAAGAAITSGMGVTYNQSFQIPVQIGTKKEQLWAHSMTVRDWLTQNKISLAKLDEVNPGKSAMITPNTKMTVIRVKKVTDTVKAPLKAKTVTKKSNRLALGVKRVVAAGHSGQVEKKYEVTYKNGKVAERQLLSQKVLKESASRIVELGTKAKTPTPKPTPAPTPAQSAASHIEPMSMNTSSSGGSHVVYASSTAYTANCSGCSGYTTTGINLKANPNTKVIAVDPSVIPLGSRVYVEGYGYAVAGDTGGAIQGNRVDVFFPTKAGAYGWGSRQVKITILN